jgi:thiopurine S-methyltransferase
MEPSFWLERWEVGKIGFHLNEVNPWLVRFSDLLGPPGRILVPLCGKTMDMAWLAERGWEVTGVELSGIAADAWFAERGLSPERRERGRFVAWSAAGVTILQGDVLELEEPAFDAVWDRAATIALPPDLRARYATRLAGAVRPGGRLLLVTLDYPQEEQGGPPFSVPEAEVERLYGAAFERTALEGAGIPSAGRPDWRVSRLAEEGWSMVRRG